MHCVFNLIYGYSNDKNLKTKLIAITEAEKLFYHTEIKELIFYELK